MAPVLDDPELRIVPREVNEVFSPEVFRGPKCSGPEVGTA